MKLRRREIRYTFSRYRIPRGEFLSRFKREVIDFMGGSTSLDQYDLVFLMFLNEIVKNIWDHADGEGRAFLSQRERGLFFEIKDQGKESHDLAILKGGGTSKPNSGVNYGIGLSHIEDWAKAAKVKELAIDCSCGFRYTGVYAPA